MSSFKTIKRIPLLSFQLDYDKDMGLHKTHSPIAAHDFHENLAEKEHSKELEFYKNLANTAAAAVAAAAAAVNQNDRSPLASPADHIMHHDGVDNDNEQDQSKSNALAVAAAAAQAHLNGTSEYISMSNLPNYYIR